MSLNDLVKELPQGANRRTILEIGRSGTGKTTSVRSLVTAEGCPGDKPFKVLFVSTEAKLTAISDLVDKGLIDVVPINEWTYPDPTIPASYQACLNSTGSNLYKVIHGLRTEEHNYDVLFIDSLMRWLLKVLWKIAQDNSNPDARSDYAIFKRIGLNLLDAIGGVSDATVTKWPVHVVATCGLEMELDPISGAKKQMAAIDGTKIAPMVAHYFDDVLVLQTRAGAEGTEYIAHTRANPEFDAKVSSPIALPPIITNLNLYRVIKKLRGEL